MANAFILKFGQDEVFVCMSSKARTVRHAVSDMSDCK